MSFTGVLQALAVVTITISFLTGLDIPHRNIELFSHFRPQYLVISAILLVTFAILRSPVYSAALLIAVVYNAVFIVPWYISDAAKLSGAPLKIIHVNVYSRNIEYQRLIDLVASEDPDIIFLQEVTADWAQGITVLLQDYPHSYAESRAGNFGIAVYSKIPLNSVRHVDSPPLSYPTIVAAITIGDETVTLISSHPTIPLGRFLYESRNEHLDSVAELVIATEGKVILLGDFNSSMWCRHYRNLERRTGLLNTRRGFGILATWPIFMPLALIPIDHALVSPGIGVVETKTGKRIGSDHLPLIVTLSL